MTFAEFLRREGASADAVALMRLGHFDVWGEGIDGVSALEILRDRALHHDARSWFKIRGGNDLLPKAFADRLVGKIHYNSPAARIEQDTRSVRVVFSQAGTNQTLAADRLICAIPFPLVKRIEASPPFSREKQEAIAQLPYTSVTRIYLQTKERFWLKRGLSGWAVTDLPIQWVWDMTPRRPKLWARERRTPRGKGPRGLLQSMTCGAEARRLDALSESERLRFALDQIETIHPGLRDHFERAASKSWDEDPWARGAYACARPGQMTTLLPHVARPEGRVHFAGEHASAWFGWQEGALESGYRAAQEVNDSG